MPQIFRPYIIDVEASGFGPHSYPIEIGLALEPGRRYSTLIMPAEGWTHWNVDAEKTHGITREILGKHGRPVKEVAEKLNDLLENRFVYSDGWVVDQPWITRLFASARLPQLFTVSAIETILSEAQMNVWHEVKDEFTQKNNLHRHRASIDAMIIQETYTKTRAISRTPVTLIKSGNTNNP
jgi:hypothetical protein